MRANRRKRELSIALRGINAAEGLEPRLLLSVAIRPATQHQDPPTGLRDGRGEPRTHDHQVHFRAEDTNPTLRQTPRINPPPARRPRPRTTPTLVPAPIDGARAYGYLKQISALGPRPAGSAANARQRELVARHFAGQGAIVREQPFSAVDPRSGATVDMVNLIGAWHPERTERVVIGVHYDTRPFPDREADEALRRLPYVGANDGASGVSLLMELAHHLDDLPTRWGVDLVLFDGEELVYGEDGEYCLGSKEFARIYAEDVKSRPDGPRYVAGLVLDMIGDKGLTIDREQYSLTFAPQLVQEVWSVARRLKAGAFRNRVGRAVYDDHVPLNDVGIPTIDIIDSRPPPSWHTASDLPEHCSAASLKQVGEVVVAWLALPRA